MLFLLESQSVFFFVLSLSLCALLCVPEQVHMVISHACASSHFYKCALA